MVFAQKNNSFIICLGKLCLKEVSNEGEEDLLYGCDLVTERGRQEMRRELDRK